MSSSVPYPVVVYVDDAGPHILVFQVPPTSKPAFSKQAQRTDVFSTAGVRQTTVLRVDQTIPISVPAILRGDDQKAWMSFLDEAVTGTPFSYFPDSSSGDYIPCFLVESDIKLAYSNAPSFSFTGTFQKELGPYTPNGLEALLSLYGGYDNVMDPDSEGLLSYIVNIQSQRV
jgi:hypothetical protein